MHKYSIEELIKGIRSRDNEVFKYLYSKYYPLVRCFINYNHGNDDDAKDVFQEALIILYRNVREKRFLQKSSLRTYIYSICHKLWMQHLKSLRSESNALVELDIPGELIDFSEEEIIENHKYNLFQKHFKNLGKDCQKILSLSLEKISQEDIVKIMGYKSVNYLKKRKHFCRKNLIRNILNDPDYKNVEKV